MKIELKIDEKNPELKVTVEAQKYDEGVAKIIDALNKLKKVDKLAVYKEEKTYFIACNDIYNIAASNNSVNIFTEKESYSSKQRLYELEAELPAQFIRISKSAIVNIDHVLSMEMEFNGKMILTLSNGNREYTSRSYLSKIKEALGIGGNKNED